MERPKDLAEFLGRAREAKEFVDPGGLPKLPPPPRLSLASYLDEAPEGERELGVIGIQFWDRHLPNLISTPAHGCEPPNPAGLPCVRGGTGHPADRHQNGCFWGAFGLPLDPEQLCLTYDYPVIGKVCHCYHRRVYRSWLPSERGIFERLTEVIRAIPRAGHHHHAEDTARLDAGTGVGILLNMYNSYDLTQGGTCSPSINGGPHVVGHGDPHTCDGHVYGFQKCFVSFKNNQLIYSCQHANAFGSDRASGAEIEALNTIVGILWDEAQRSGEGHHHGGSGGLIQPPVHSALR